MTATRPRSPALALAALALAALALAALALALAACAVPPDPARWKPCADGTICPADAACFGDNQCLGCEAVRHLTETTAWTRCDGRLCPDEDGCSGDPSRCMVDTCGDGCQCDPVVTGCGDGITAGKENGEYCDDGNRINGDGCDNNCTITDCGNGIITTGEDCDDGNLDDDDECDNNCKLPAPPGAPPP